MDVQVIGCYYCVDMDVVVIAVVKSESQKHLCKVLRLLEILDVQIAPVFVCAEITPTSSRSFASW